MDKMAGVTALVLAGTRPGGDPFADAQGVSHKGLIAISGQPILQHVCTALAESGIGRTVVATNTPEIAALAQDIGAEILAAEAGPSASVAAAFDRYGAPLLVTTSDHALLQGAWVRDFIGDTPEAADLSILLARRAEVEAVLPGTRRTWMKMADGDWSGCNLFFLARPAAREAIGLWNAVEANRKRPLRIAARLGWGTLLRYVLGRLTMEGIVARIGRRVGIEIAVIVSRSGLAAVDVDKVEDLDLVRRLMEEDRD